MNIYEKLQNARVELQGMDIKKSGANKFAGYQYFELSDFLPKVNEIFAKLKLFSQVSFTTELATLTITDAEKPENFIVFTSPMASAQLKGCHEIQNLGAVQTYQRRYLYTMAMEIVEFDALDATTGKEAITPKAYSQPTTQSDSTGELISEAQQKRLFILSKGDTAKAKGVMLKYGYTESKQIKKADYNKICAEIEAGA